MFDVIIIVDWSANATPKRGPDSIWTYELDRSATPHPPMNHPTRHATRGHLAERLQAHSGRRVLLGFDFAFGYPSSFAAQAGLDGATAWWATWTHLAATVVDDDRNRNNRWTVAADLNARLGRLQFWGVPAARRSQWLTTTKPPLELPEHRETERTLRSAANTRPFSVWQLLGAGAVGSQTLTGIPVLHHLRTHPALADRVRVWPFETGFTTDPCAGHADAVIVAEVWPSAVSCAHLREATKDACQVRALAEHFAQADVDGCLAAAFDPAVDTGARAAVLGEEGWVLHCDSTEPASSTRS